MANSIGCVNRSCLLLFRARGAGDGFLKLTYMLIEAKKRWVKDWAFIHLFKFEWLFAAERFDWVFLRGDA